MVHIVRDEKAITGRSICFCWKQLHPTTKAPNETNVTQISLEISWLGWRSTGIILPNKIISKGMITSLLNHTNNMRFLGVMTVKSARKLLTIPETLPQASGNNNSNRSFWGLKMGSKCRRIPTPINKKQSNENSPHHVLANTDVKLATIFDEPFAPFFDQKKSKSHRLVR